MHISIDEAVEKYPWLEPERLRGAIQQGRSNDPAGNADAGTVQDDVRLQRYAVRIANEVRS